ELLLTVRLDLQPVARALAPDVPGVEPLRQDPLEALFLRSLEQRCTVVERLRHPYGGVAAVEELLQALPPLDQRQIDERLAVDLEDVEDVVHERRSRLPLLHGGEARAARVVEGGELPVHHGVRSLIGLGG